MRNNISIGPVAIRSSEKKEIIERINEIPIMIDNIFDKFFIVIRSKIYLRYHSDHKQFGHL